MSKMLCIKTDVKLQPTNHCASNITVDFMLKIYLHFHFHKRFEI